MRKLLYVSLLLCLSACSHLNKNTSQDSSKNKEDNIPKLTRPVVRRIWVPDEIRENEFIQGHWKYLLEKEAVWAK
ncbi:MAG: hypothetical protein JNM24_04720 [Bdellovibrionaceae bacterium]|nr:hypothetical protein [Pseudobdellovibrionaceae bacterium]